MASTGGVKIGGGYDEARTRKVTAEAKIAELELAKVVGDLVVAEDVVAAWDDVLGAFKGKLLNIPVKAAPLVAAETDDAVCQVIYEDLINEALEELSNYDPKINPAKSKSVKGEPKGSTAKAKTPAKTKYKRVGRPRKAAGLAN